MWIKHVCAVDWVMMFFFVISRYFSDVENYIAEYLKVKVGKNQSYLVYGRDACIPSFPHVSLDFTDKI